jgi:hypothetical protein
MAKPRFPPLTGVMQTSKAPNSSQPISEKQNARSSRQNPTAHLAYS